MVVLLTFGWKHIIMYYSVVNVTAWLEDIQNIPASQKLATHQIFLQTAKNESWRGFRIALPNF